MKCGFANSNFPHAIFPCMVGRPVLRFEEKIGNVQIKDIMIGDEATRLRNMLQITYPLDNGIVRNWDDMLHVWDYTFNEKLKINANECKIMLTEAPQNPMKNRQMVSFSSVVVVSYIFCFCFCFCLFFPSSWSLNVLFHPHR